MIYHRKHLKAKQTPKVSPGKLEYIHMYKACDFLKRVYKSKFWTVKYICFPNSGSAVYGAFFVYKAAQVMPPHLKCNLDHNKNKILQWVPKAILWAMLKNKRPMNRIKQFFIFWSKEWIWWMHQCLVRLFKSINQYNCGCLVLIFSIHSICCNP